MGELSAAVQGVLAVCGGIAALGGATAVIVRWMSPFKKLKERVDRLEERCVSIEAYAKDTQEDNNRRFAKDLAALEELENTTRLTLRAMIGLLDHAVTNNGKDHLNALKEEVQKYLIER